MIINDSTDKHDETEIVVKKHGIIMAIIIPDKAGMTLIIKLEHGT